ncbi:hypothetical protein T07_3022 [Trichinella nelsoni]|uniref:Uncharacterized protein n=1 Tax=Trichinella nelsoni TaxID=6336 RepID=A0A0V0RBE6_9BILA|nr:hypothetical protein T07_3022 [Trichinella nelsoni]
MTSLPARVISSLTPQWIRSVGSHEKAVCLAKQEVVCSFGQLGTSITA